MLWIPKNEQKSGMNPSINYSTYSELIENVKYSIIGIFKSNSLFHETFFFSFDQNLPISTRLLSQVPISKITTPVSHIYLEQS